MSGYWTLAMIKNKVELDLDLQDETFIEPDELTGYINEGVREGEAEVHGIYEDYFLKRTPLTLVTGVEEYDLPTGIYAHKIRRIVYRNGTKVYTVDRIRDHRKFEEYALEQINKSSTTYNYFLTNDSPGNVKILLSPPGKEDGAFITIWHIRSAQQMVLDTDICDIPEFVNFIIAFAKVQCLTKDIGNPNLQLAVAYLEQQRGQMTSTLASMVPDANNEIEPDLSMYTDMS